MLERFLRYVRIDTQSEEGASTYPSTAKQLDLSRILADELREIGLDDVELNEFGYVYRDAPGHAGRARDRPRSPTSIRRPSRRAPDVSPIVHEDYAGEPIVLPGDPSQILDPARSRRSRRGSGTTSSRATARRCSGPTTRPAWRRSWPPSPTSAGRARAARNRARRLHGRRGGRARRRSLRHRGFGAEAAYTLDGSGVGRDRDRVVLGPAAEGASSGARRASGNGEGQARERGQACRRLRRRAAARRPLARDDRGSRRLRPSDAGSPAASRRRP